MTLTWLVRRSRFGLQLLAIRDDEERARGLGVRVGRIKLTAFVLSAIPVGMVGGIYAYFLGQIFPQFAFDPLFDLSIALMAFIGGLGTLAGPLLGALVLESLQQYFTVQYGASQAYLIIYGVLFLVVVLAAAARRDSERRGADRAVARAIRGTRRGPGGARPHRRRGQGGGGSMSALLEVEGVCKSFGGLQALTDTSLSVAQGQIAGLIGPNGSGKTTLFNVMTGYERCHAGEIRLNGESITRAPPERVFALGIGRTFQITRLFFRLTVLENILVATQRHEGWIRSVARRASSEAERGRALEMLEFVGLGRLAARPAGELSYGQRKLLELASLLVADPAVLLLDEPTAGVNPTLINQLSERIRELNRAGKTFLVVEHNMEFVMGLCQQVTVLHQGRTLVTGTPDQVRANPAVLDAYLGGADDDDV